MRPYKKQLFIMRKIKVGLIQQSNSEDIRTNLRNLAKNIEECAARGAELVVLQELHNSLYFCQTENTDLFDLAEPIPGPSTGFYSELAAMHKIVLVTSLFEKRAPGLYHNTAVVFDSDGSMAGKYRKMHIPTIRHITKSFISLREISGSNRFRHLWENWAYWYAGISGIRKQPA